MPVNVTIRNVPDETRDELAARAALAGQSLQEYLRAHLIDFAEVPDNAALVARVLERKRNARRLVTTEEILKYRDMDRL